MFNLVWQVDSEEESIVDIASKYLISSQAMWRKGDKGLLGISGRT